MLPLYLIIGFLAAFLVLVILAFFSILSELFFQSDLLISSEHSQPFLIIFLAAAIEEIVRVLILWTLLLRSRPTNTPLRAGALFGLGFATTEIGLYSMGQMEIFAFSPSLLTTPLVHIILSVLGAFAAIKYRAFGTKKLLLAALLVMITLHTLYNIALF